MFSNSSSYLGGANSARPGAPQYGQQSYLQQPQQQQNGFPPQATGYGQTPLQQQYTGYVNPGQQQQSHQAPLQQQQYTGFIPQNQQPAQNQFPQQQEVQTGQQPQQQLPPQKTGQTSSQIAQSFSSTPAQGTTSATSSNIKIPKIRLSFLTATDQAKFEQLFKSAVGEGQALDGRPLGRWWIERG